MIEGPLLFLLLVLLGAILSADGTSVGQFMLSRPLVAATLAGALAGAPMYGMVVGVILEALHLTVLPFGAARYPEGGAPAVVGGAAYVLNGGGVGALVTVVVFVLAWEWVGGETVRFMRKVNMRLLPRFDVRGTKVRAVVSSHLLAVGVDLVRGAALTAVGLVVLGAVLDLPDPYWGPGGWWAWVALGAAASAGLAATIRMFGLSRVGYFLAGAAGGFLFLFLA